MHNTKPSQRLRNWTYTMLCTSQISQCSIGVLTQHCIRTIVYCVSERWGCVSNEYMYCTCTSPSSSSSFARSQWSELLTFCRATTPGLLTWTLNWAESRGWRKGGRERERRGRVERREEWSQGTEEENMRCLWAKREPSRRETNSKHNKFLAQACCFWLNKGHGLCLYVDTDKEYLKWSFSTEPPWQWRQ